jgi:hypothetical protein
MALKALRSDADLLRLMSEIISLREQVAQAELRAHHLRQAHARLMSISSTKRRGQKRR